MQGEDMRLTKQTGHAIRILIDCAEAGDRLVKVAEISNRLDVTKQNVFKIVHILSHAGFLAPVRGPSGGVKLALPAADIKIGDVVRAVEVTHVQVEGASTPRSKDKSPGPINVLLDDALAAFISVLDQHTLADLAADSSRQVRLGAEDSASSRSSSRETSRKPATRATRRAR